MNPPTTINIYTLENTLTFFKSCFKLLGKKILGGIEDVHLKFKGWSFLWQSQMGQCILTGAHPGKNQHDNGKTTNWSCISYETRWIFQISMLVFFAGVRAPKHFRQILPIKNAKNNIEVLEGQDHYNIGTLGQSVARSKCAVLRKQMRQRYLGVSKNRGTPKWMVYNGKPYWNWWFGGKTHYWEKETTFLQTLYILWRCFPPIN